MQESNISPTKRIYFLGIDFYGRESNIFIHFTLQKSTTTNRTTQVCVFNHECLRIISQIEQRAKVSFAVALKN